jgi:nitrite reductase/ring-hydroxylating ferredoxin subunit
MFVLLKKYKIWTTLSLVGFSYINYRYKTIYNLSMWTTQNDINNLIETNNLPLLTQLIEQNNLTHEKVEEEYLVLGDPDLIKPGMLVQFDLAKLRHSKNKEFFDNLKDHFQKIIVTKYDEKFCVLSSFCGYDFTDLAKGELIGNRLICPNCLSEYNIENGHIEQGPNTKELACFPASVRDGQLKIKIPTPSIPLFQLPTIAERDNPVDPRNYVFIGDNETILGAIETIIRAYTGKITIITNKEDTKFYDFNKLKSSFFPIKSSYYVKLITDDYLRAYKINKYDNKVSRLDGVNRVITLDNGLKIPFDKVLIAVGAQRKKVEATDSNIFNLYTIEDHMKIHNVIVKPETKTIAIISKLLEGFDIATTLRTYLNSIEKADTNIIIINETDSVLEKLCPNVYLVQLQKYLQSQNIQLFRGIEAYEFEMNPNNGKVKKTNFNDKKYYYNLNTDICIIQDDLDHSNADFIGNITISPGVIGDQVKFMFGNYFLIDERMSLHNNDSYPFVFSAGNCSLNMSGLDIMERGVLTTNFRTNYQLGHFGALNMLEKHPPFDDLIVNSVKLMNKKLTFVGNDRQNFTHRLVLDNEKNGDFCVFLFTNNRLTGFLIYGFKNLHIYARELLRYNIFPSYSFVKNNLNNMPEFIINEIRKQPHNCYREKIMADYEINLYKYTIQDQAYITDLVKRTKVAMDSEKNKIEEKYIKDKETADKKEKELKEKIMKEQANKVKP